MHPSKLLALSIFLAPALLVRQVDASAVKGHIDCNKQTTFCLIKGLTINGAIDDGTPVEIQQLVDDFNSKSDSNIQSRGLAGTEIELNSPGGSVTAAMATGRLLRRYRMTATVKPGAECDSACILVYAGAVVRYGHFNSGRIGIHQPYFEVPQQSVDPGVIRTAYANMLRDMRSYLHEMNVSEQLADEMLKTLPSNIRYLSPEEQDKFGLVIFDPVETEISSLEQAQKFGLSRAEYIRREAISTKVCDVGIEFFTCVDAVLRTGKAPLPDLRAFGTPVQ